MSTIVQQLAALAATARDSGLSPELRADVARRVLDVLGNCLFAADAEPGQAVLAVARAWGGAESATAVGVGFRAPAASVALINGTLAHTADFDDTHLPSVLHPSSSVVPAALALGEQLGVSGAAILDAAGVGIEIAVRLGMGGYNIELGNSVFFERGFHATSICGTIGAAAAAGMLLELDEAGLADAMGIAASMGAGLIEANRTGGSVKRIHCGWAAHAGITAAQLAQAGLTGPPTVVEGRFGFLQAYCGDEAVPSQVTDRLGEHWELPGIFFKPYPCNHFTHAGIDAALQLRADGLDLARIDHIQLGAPTPVLRTIGEPAEEKASPRSGYHAAFSGPYTVAAALVGGGGLGLGHEDFTDELAADPARLALAAKVTCVADARCDEIFPNQFPAVLRVGLDDGTVREVRVDANRGGPERPLSPEELAGKFRLNAQERLSDEEIDTVVRLVGELAYAETVRPLMAAVG